jgi:hypothetical protein
MLSSVERALRTSGSCFLFPFAAAVGSCAAGGQKRGGSKNRRSAFGLAGLALLGDPWESPPVLSDAYDLDDALHM